MNACNLSCVIFLASSGKAVYLFGDISANLTPVEAEGVFAQVQVSITCIQRIPFRSVCRYFYKSLARGLLLIYFNYKTSLFTLFILCVLRILKRYFFGVEK